MSGALYAGSCLLGTLEKWPGPFSTDHWLRFRFVPSAGYEAYRALLEPPDRRKLGTAEWLAAVDALDLRLVLGGTESRYTCVSVEGDLLAVRAGALRFSAEQEKAWREELARRRSRWQRLLDALTPWSKHGED